MSFTDTKIFLDTNIIAYIFDARDTMKQKTAKALFSELVKSQNCVVSTQVLHELFNVLTKKLKYTKADAQTIVYDLMNLTVHQLSLADTKMAMNISSETQLTIYDSLIVAAAVAEKCDIVYSEDLNDGQLINGVQIRNPLYY